MLNTSAVIGLPAIDAEEGDARGRRVRLPAADERPADRTAAAADLNDERVSVPVEIAAAERVDPAVDSSRSATASKHAPKPDAKERRDGACEP